MMYDDTLSCSVMMIQYHVHVIVPSSIHTANVIYAVTLVVIVLYECETRGNWYQEDKDFYNP